MALLRLDSYDRKEMELPDVCMQCGAPATVIKSKTFSWFPSWVWILLVCGGLLPFVIVALIVTKRRTVDAPFCEEHKNHWLWRQGLMFSTFAGVFALGFVAWVMVMDNNGRQANPIGGFLCIGSLILLVAWIILAVVVQSTSIRAQEITDQDIILAGVSKEFVAAYKQEWHVAPERLDEVVREHWNQSGRSPRTGRRTDENIERIHPAEDEDDRLNPPDTFHEGSS